MHAKRWTAAGAALLLSTLSLVAQDRPGQTVEPAIDVLQRDDRGVPTWVAGRLGQLATAQPFEAAAESFLTRFVRDHLGGSGDETFALPRVNTDPSGARHVRFRQTIDGREVMGAMMIVHVDAVGQVIGVNGRAAVDRAMPRKAQISAAEAFAQAQAKVGIADGTLAAKPELRYVMTDDGLTHLTWKVRVRYVEDGDKLVDDLDVDAVDGALVREEPLVSFVRNRKTYTLNNGLPPVSPLPGTLIGNESIPPSSDAVALLTHQNVGVVWDFYSQVFGRDSLDGQGLPLVSTVHYGVNNNQAAYVHEKTPRQMWFGDGSYLQFRPFGRGLDIVAHEMTHGVFRHEVNITSNAVNLAVYESFSDIFAASAEAWADGGVNADTWRIGEDVIIKSPNKIGGIRIMNDPAADGVSPDHFSDFSTNLGVTQNAGIMNLAFYLISEGGTHPDPQHASVTVTGVGIDKASEVFYRALLDYLPTSPQFTHVRLGALSAATQLYGGNSTTYHAVNDAFCLVGIGPGC